MNKTQMKIEVKSNCNGHCAFCDGNGICRYSHKACAYGTGNMACSSYMPISVRKNRTESKMGCPERYEVSARGLKRSFFSVRRWTGPKIYHMCTGKVRFRTEYDARDNARRHWDKDRSELRTYECPCCGGYHLTSKYVVIMVDAA